MKVRKEYISFIETCLLKNEISKIIFSTSKITLSAYYKEEVESWVAGSTYLQWHVGLGNDDYGLKKWIILNINGGSKPSAGLLALLFYSKLLLPILIMVLSKEYPKRRRIIPPSFSLSRRSTLPASVSPSYLSLARSYR